MSVLPAIVLVVHPQATVDEVRRLFASGLTPREIEHRIGLAYSTVSHWCRGDRRTALAPSPRTACPRCTGATLDEHAYAYLLGSYLGDGHITVARRTTCLSIYCADDLPGIQTEVRDAMRAVRSISAVSAMQRQGCSQIKSYYKHWTCLFPQHGPGMKHTRPIVLESWQDEIVESHTEPFLRGLFHSDGCRMTNWTRRMVAGELKRYEYPRYFFSNKSTDILDLCAAGLDRLGIAHRRPRWDTISVARREAVAALDVFVGPKT